MQPVVELSREKSAEEAKQSIKDLVKCNYKAPSET